MYFEKLAHSLSRAADWLAEHKRTSLRANTRAAVRMEGIGFGLAVLGGIIALAALVGLIFVPVATFPLIDAELLAVIGVVLLVAGVGLRAAD